MAALSKTAKSLLTMLRNYFFFLRIGSILGSRFIFRKMAVVDFPPLRVGAGRSQAGFLTLLTICQFLGLKGKRGQWFKFSLIGLLEATIPFVLVAWGQQYFDIAVAAILMGTVPSFTVMLAPLVIKGGALPLLGWACTGISRLSMNDHKFMENQ